MSRIPIFENNANFVFLESLPFKVDQFIYRHAGRGVCPVLDEEHSDQSLVRELDTAPTILYISFDKPSINPYSQQTLVSKKSLDNLPDSPLNSCHG